jgi:glucosamine--fructose-6-phosphate aminotransferase (isomerizing)
MCGIVGYIGTRYSAKDILLDGLKSLEYRGYDSAGMAFVQDGLVVYKRVVGEVDNLKSVIKEQEFNNDIEGGMQFGVAHTRWATHGGPLESNAHPHKSGDIYLVHNGIIENYSSLKESVLTKDNTIEFKSETDSEVLVHMINILYARGVSLQDAVRESVASVQGSYAIAVMSITDGEIVVARDGSPLVLGIINQKESVDIMLASDSLAISNHADQIIYLDDGDIISIKCGQYNFIQGKVKAPIVLGNCRESVSLSGFKHFMLKEICEQAKVLHDAQSGRAILETGDVIIDGISDIIPEILKARRIIIVSCGTSYNAGLLAAQFIESLAAIPVQVEYSSEFKYKDTKLDKRDIVLAISQSGETADTLSAIRKAKESGLLTISIVNTKNSAISRESDVEIYNNAGPEISVASTKAFSSQIATALLLAVMIGRRSGNLQQDIAMELLSEFAKLPEILNNYISLQSYNIREIATRYSGCDNMFYLGRGRLVAIAREGALKIKEISYIHAESYPAGEMKHGPLALIDNAMLSVVLAPMDSLYKKSLSTIQEVKARGGRVIAVTTEQNTELQDMADDVILIPGVTEILLPFITIVPMQLFAYYMAMARGCNIDKPRNLAKSVTVE